jgi:hypothetical protein
MNYFGQGRNKVTENIHLKGNPNPFGVGNRFETWPQPFKILANLLASFRQND